MKKIFDLRNKKGKSPLGSFTILGRDRGHHRTSFQPRYHIQDRDLGKIHKAASVGNVPKVQQVLLLGKNGLDDKDKMNRTALHLACANGHSAVVALLLERKCLLNLCDSENKTPLMKAVECQEEECATLLLEHGADPNVMDINGNTALHYAVFCQNVSLVAKLLSYNANIEAKNKDDLTPLLFGIKEGKQQIVEFLVRKEANIHAVDKMKRTALILAINYESLNIVSLLLQRGADVFSQDVFGRTAEEYAAVRGFNIVCELISAYKEKRPTTPPEKSNSVDKSSEEDSLSRFSSKPGVDSQFASDDEVLDFETKPAPKPNLIKLMEAFQQSKRKEAGCGIVRQESTTFSENNNSDSEIEDVVETFPKPSPGVQGFSHPAFPRPDSLPKPLKTLAGLGLAKEGATKPELVEKDADIIERAPQEQANHDHLTSIDRARENDRSGMMSGVGLGEEKDTESPWDSESISESVPQKFVDHLSGDQRGKNTLNGQVQGSPAAAAAKSPEKCPNVKPAVGGKDSVPNKTVGMKDPQTSSSDWDLTSFSLSGETCQRAGQLKVDDQRPLVSQSVTKNQSASTELRQKTVTDKGKMKNAAVFLVGNSTPHHPCQSPLPGNRGSKEDSSDWDLTSFSLSGEICQRAGHLKVDDQRPLVSPSVTKSPSALGQKTITDKGKMKNAAVFLVGNSTPHHPCESPLPGNRGSKEDSSDWDLTSFSLSGKTCQRAGHLKVDDQRPLVSPSVTKSPSALGQKTITDKGKMKNAAVFLVGNSTPHHPCQSPLPGNRGSKEDSSDWDLTSFSLSGKTCQRAGHLKVDDQRPLVSPSVTKSPSALGQKTITDKGKMKNAAVFLVGNSTPHHPCQSPLPGNRGSKEDLSGELDLEVILKEEQEKPDGDEKNRLQVEGEKKHRSSEVKASDNVCNAAAESRLIQQRKSGGNNKQAFPATESKGSDSSDRGVPRKEIEKKNNDKWTQEERVIAPIFEKTVSLTGGLLHVNGDSILRKADQDDGRTARKTAYEKKKVSDSGRKAKHQLRKNLMQNEITSLRLETDTVKNQNQEQEKKCFEDIEIVKGENDYPQKAKKLNKETLTKAIFQHTGQLNVPIAENTMLNPELENAKQSKQRLKTEVESYRSRLAAATHDHDQGQTSQRGLELASQKAEEKRLCLQNQMKFDMAKLESNNKMLSQQLSKMKNKFNQLNIKLHQTRDDLREKTLMLERVQRDLRQTECQKQDIEHMYQNQQGKVNEYLGKQESLEERVSQLQSENILLRQQLVDTQNRADSMEKTVISIQDQLEQSMRKHAEHEKQVLMLEERNKELVNKWNHVEERMRQYENEKAEREAVVKHLQELSHTFKKQSALEASLDVISRHRDKLEVEARDLKSNLCQLTSQLQETKDQHTEAVRCAEKTQDHIQKLEIENAKLQTTVKKQAGRIEQLQKNLLSIRSTDDLPAELETARSECLHMNAKIQVLQEELLSMKGMQKKCEKLEKNKNKLEQKVVNLKAHIEMNMIEYSQVEQYKQEIEERVRQDLIEKLREINMFLQMQQELDRSITRELEEVDAEFASNSFRVSP